VATGGYALGIGALCVPCLLAAVLMMQLMRVRSVEDLDLGVPYEEEAVG
jgi:hypothetical protein